MEFDPVYLFLLTFIALAIFWRARTMRRRSMAREGDLEPEKENTAKAGGSEITALERALRGSFSKKPLFNASELKVFKILVDEVAKTQSGLYVVGQTSMREVLNTDSRFKKGGSFYALSDRRLDFAVIDNKSNIVLAVEYHGSGHHQGNSAERDEIKTIALRKAGVSFLVIENHLSEKAIRERVCKHFSSKTNSSIVALGQSAD